MHTETLAGPDLLEREQLLLTIDLTPGMTAEDRGLIIDYVRRALHDVDDRIFRIWVDQPTLPYLKRFTVARDGRAYVVLDLGGRGQHIPAVVAHTASEDDAFRIADALAAQHEPDTEQREEATA